MNFKKILLLCLILLPIISAAQINMENNFSQDETLIAQISGNFVNPLQEENVLLFKDHERVSFLPSVKKIEGDFYVYGQLLGKSEGNYSLVLKNAEYIIAREIKEEDIFKEFRITNETADFLVEPGFIETNESFFIEVENLKSSKITIESRLENYSKEDDEESGFFDSLFGGSQDNENWNETEINPGEIKKIYFNIDDVIFNESILKQVILKTENTVYKIPSLLEKFEEIEKEKSLEIRPLKSTVSLSTDSETSRFFYLNNSGRDLENLTISVSQNLRPYVSVTNGTIDLNENSTEKIEINISSGEKEEFIEGRITVTDGEIYSSLSLSLNFSKSFIPDGENGPTSLFETCEELNGRICDRNQKCIGETENTEEGVCCLGACEEENNDSTRKIVGWILIVLIIGTLAWFFLNKYKKIKRPIDLLKIAKRKKKTSK